MFGKVDRFVFFLKKYFTKVGRIELECDLIPHVNCQWPPPVTVPCHSAVIKFGVYFRAVVQFVVKFCWNISVQFQKNAFFAVGTSILQNIV